MNLVVKPSQIGGEIIAPSSKGHTIAALFASLLAGGRSKISEPLYSRDVDTAIYAVRRFGGLVQKGERDLIVDSPPRPWWPRVVNCRRSSTVLRHSIVTAALAPGISLVYGDSHTNSTPVSELAGALKKIGAEVVTTNGRPPVAVKGPLARGCCEGETVGASDGESLAALLLASPLLGFAIKRAGTHSWHHVAVALHVLRGFGAKISFDGGIYYPDKPYGPGAYAVPGDYVNAAPLLLAGAIAGRITVRRLDPEDPQGEKVFLNILAQAGAKLKAGESSVEVVGTGSLEGFEADVSETPSLAPVLAVLAAYAKGRSVIKGISHLRLKEGGNLKPLMSNLRRLKVKAKPRCGGDCLEVYGEGYVEGGTAKGYGDPRMTMAFAVAGLASRKGVRVTGASRYRDYYPGFVEDLRSVGAVIEAD
ncbi:3-phosphoshikimate 1-carboxyvinyltransferase [Aeropyrum pernix K1]|uniref:3-phosphoshikimate 1-carboxyvinyltransferase n=1 Tax=Aeropyrum pernix (strain ATCC 700893 / DSM 11879 / JCM 9820 / NBRC 100138 / K1) TaxID=272557 RepID=Q9YC47_AERPE|nr:3-phosphoshikimate 1-carboxyvinyltransferase [Aeropyrum pernix K1]